MFSTSKYISTPHEHVGLVKFVKSSSIGFRNIYDEGPVIKFLSTRVLARLVYRMINVQYIRLELHIFVKFYTLLVITLL
jgi:hypothetical protein